MKYVFTRKGKFLDLKNGISVHKTRRRGKGMFLDLKNEFSMYSQRGKLLDLKNGVLTCFSKYDSYYLKKCGLHKKGRLDY